VQRGTELGGPRDDARRRLGIDADRRTPSTQDAGLLTTDALAVVAEPRRVVEVDRRQEREIGVDQVDRVETATETDLEQHGVRRGVGEHHQRSQRGVLEVGQPHVASRGLDPCERGAQRRVVDRHAGQAHPLVKCQQMRRGVGTDTVAGGSEDRLQKGNHRALAIGAGDRDRAGRRRQREFFVDPGNPLETELDLVGVARLDVGEPGVQRGRQHSRVQAASTSGSGPGSGNDSAAFGGFA
jgi:hypothetical protein